MHRRFLTLATVALLPAGACASHPPPAPATYELVVLSTTDVHGRLRGWDYHANALDTLRGLARVATVVDSIRGEEPGRVILVDAGDLLQGNPLTYVAARVAPRQPHPVAAAMNAVGYDAAAIGNHEFNYGLELLDEVVEQSRFAWLATNVRTLAGRHAYAPWHIVQRGPVRVAIIGATTPGSMAWDRQHLQGRLVIRDIIESVRAAETEVRRAGADVVIAVLHAGLDGRASYDTVTTGYPGENVAARLAAEVPGLALIVYGHSHREMADTMIAGTRLIQPRFWATNVGMARLRLERSGRSWRVVSSSGELLPVAGRREAPAVLAAIEEAHRAAVSYVATPIGSTPVQWRADSTRVAGTSLMGFMLEVQRRVAGAELSAGAAFSLTAGLGPGSITISDVTRLYPYENTLKSIRITGRQLREYLEFTSRHFGTWDTDEPAIDPTVPGFNFDMVLGVEYTIDLRRPAGGRITSLTRSGRAVADADSFTMAINNYRQGGGGGYTMIADAPVLYDGGDEVRDLLIDEIRRRATLRPEDYPVPSWRIVPEEAAARAWRIMNRTQRPGGPPAAAGSGTR